MHIYIDESGQFRPMNRSESRASAVVALVVPSANRMALGKALRNAKRLLGYGGSELKGSSLSEEAIVHVLSVLRQHDAIAEAVVVDSGEHDSATVERFKFAQAEQLLTHITRDHYPTLIQDLLALEARVKRLPNQLFLQVFCLWQLVPQVLETATMFYAQRMPRELGSFTWRVDAKDTRLTEAERIWTELIGPLIMTRTEARPMGMMPGGDYSFYDRFDMTPPPHISNPEGRHFTDMRKVLRDDHRFVRSHDDLGVQAADVLVSALTRALNGALGQAAWGALGPLFIKRADSTVRLIALNAESTAPHSAAVKSSRWVSVIRAIEARARPMLTARTGRLLRESDG